MICFCVQIVFAMFKSYYGFHSFTDLASYNSYSENSLVEQFFLETMHLQRNYIHHKLSILDDKAFRKHLLCLKIQSSKTAINAVCDIVLINRTKGETAPPGFHLIA